MPQDMECPSVGVAPRRTHSGCASFPTKPELLSVPPRPFLLSCQGLFGFHPAPSAKPEDTTSQAPTMASAKAQRSGEGPWPEPRAPRERYYPDATARDTFVALGQGGPGGGAFPPGGALLGGTSGVLLGATRAPWRLGLGLGLKLTARRRGPDARWLDATAPAEEGRRVRWRRPRRGARPG